MRKRSVLLATASLAICSSRSFSVHDDLFAFPQYEVVFLDTSISDIDASSRLSYASSISSARAKSTPPTTSSTPPSNDNRAELSTSSLTHRIPGNDQEPEDEELPKTYERMVLKFIPYLCSIPEVPPVVTNVTAAAQSKAEEAKELARASDRGWELLKDMEGQCMYLVSGWWSYAFCYQQQVKQFHALPPGRGGVPSFPPTEDETAGSYVLGQFGAKQRKNKAQIGAKESSKDIGSPSAAAENGERGTLHTKGDMRYLVQQLGDGTQCDLTGKARKVEVQFHCDPHMGDRIGWIKEVATCAYLMVIYTPRLCDDVAFLPPRQTKAHAIQCQEIVAEDALADWTARKAAAAERQAVDAALAAKDKKEAAAAAAAAAKPVVGGIAIGGQKLVGKEGSRIEPPKPPTSEGKPNVILRKEAAKDGGKLLRRSHDDLKKMDLDPAEVEMWRGQLDEVAGENAWTLEMKRVGNVMQLLGTVDAGDKEVQYVKGDEEGEDGKKGEGKGGGEGGAGERKRKGEGKGKGKGEEGSEEEYKDEL